MATHLMIENFVGNPEELYTFVAEEINKRQLPGYTFGWIDEVESTKMFNKGDKAKALLITFRGYGMRVLGYQIGRIFHASLRTTTMPHISDAATAGFLHDITSSVYVEIVKRSFKEALRRQMAAQQAPIPQELDPAGIFLVPERPDAAEAQAS